ncbi:MAG TPA: AAA family ATPase, partial [Anaerolineae bacterium]|nr:AAA family ATPase [Anaerolineae bacterium]
MSGRGALERPAESSRAGLHVHLLGPPGVEWAGRSLTIPRSQARALLYRLAVRLQPVPRASLCFLFWPDTPDSVAHRNLSHLLTHLRRALPVPDVLQVTQDTVGLDPQRAWSDTAVFETACTGVKAHHPQEAFQQVVNLYRSPFLDGFSLPDSPEFDAWITQERRTWERLYLKALSTLIEHGAASGAHADAIAYARRYLETDDLAEEIHRRLIILYALSGDRGAALRQFEDCTAILERELGVSPLPETRAVYRTVLEGRALPRPRPVVASGWATLPSLEMPLVGRDRAMHQLVETYRHAGSSHGRVVFISGEAGVGKSRLMQDFATRVQDQALVLVGVSLPGLPPAPFQAVVQALRSGLDIEHTVFNTQPCWLAEASRLLPELRNRHPDLSPVAAEEPGEARLRLLEALCQLILSLAAGPHPVLLCLDDVHWCDGATLDWLADLGRRLSSQRLLVCGTYRGEEADAVKELRRSLARLGILVELKLQGLDQAGVLELLQHTAGHLPREESLAARLHRATGGNPFFLLETLRTLMETGELQGDLGRLENLPLPDTVQAAVTARLQRLDPKARQVIEAGAILGATFGFELVRLTAGRDELETIDGLDELVARQLLVEQPGEYQFIHDLTRRAVEVTLGPMRRQLLHRRAGRALEQLEPDAVASLAYHFDSGGEVEKGLRYHGLAAQQAERLFAWQEAEKHQGRMLVSLDRLDAEYRRTEYVTQRGQVLAARADLRFLQGRLT